jgi:hypothetical protein
MDLQGGTQKKLDVADRLFHSFRETYRSCLDSSDVKELIPEIFYMPMIFCAEAPLGVRQNGEFVQHVVFDQVGQSSVENDPIKTNRAKDDKHHEEDDPRRRAQAFVRQQRRRLESRNVSKALPKWIDLIFGIQSGSWTADNVFFHLTYAEHVPRIPLFFGPDHEQHGHDDPAMEAGTLDNVYRMYIYIYIYIYIYV